MMNEFPSFRQMFKDLLSTKGVPELTPEEDIDLKTRLEQAFEEEISTDPKIGVMGPTGVGKSTTINALFGTNLPIGHTKATTKVVYEIEAKGPNGSLAIFDMPGIGEDLEADQKHIQIYMQMLQKCDVVLWVMSAPDRRIAYDQLMIREIIMNAPKSVSTRLVIGVNKADLVHPSNWIKRANLPSYRQKKNLEERQDDIQNKLIKVCPRLTQDQIIVYSAEKRYKLDELFKALLAASIEERAWVINSREYISDYWEFVEKELRPPEISSQND